jgi:acyl carrier protein
MRTYTRIENRIKNVIADEFKIANRHLSSETNLKEDLGLDEYDMIFLSLALENEFEIMLNQKMDHISEIKDLVPFVLSNTSSNLAMS